MEIDSTSHVVKSGVIMIATKVETVVRLTERAVLVRAMKHTTLEAVPPGQHATKTSPIV